MKKMLGGGVESSATEVEATRESLEKIDKSCILSAMT